ncbi:MAG: YkgJ family cysteine cluster protein [Saprospiraceae bacterium]|nr:YkgJ family cysteine cluster protein [Saprospiraceae bacterium]
MEEIINDWRKNAGIQKKENFDFLKKLKSVPGPELIPLLQKSHDEAFHRIDCLGCANCCKTTPPLITKNDLNRISKHLNISPKQFKRRFVLDDVNGDMMFNGVPCRFLNEDNSCLIYEVRPEACRKYPHTNELEYQDRALLNAANTVVCPAAFYVIQRLKTEFDYL